MGALLCEEGTRCHEEEEDEKGATCRVCWETDAEERLCSPCKCIGALATLAPWCGASVPRLLTALTRSPPRLP